MSDEALNGEIELRVDREALAAVQNLRIPANFAEVGAALKGKLVPYSTLLVTEETIPSAKTARASVNRLRANIDEYRKTVKKLLSAPAAEFEANCKPLLALCDEAAANIDGQVKAFERREKDQKISALRIYFSQQIGEDARFLSFEDVFNPRWENKTFSEEQAQKEIITAIASVRAALGAIHSLHSKFESALIDRYLKTRDLAACMQYNEKLLAEQDRIERDRVRVELEAAEKAREAVASAETVAAQTTASVSEVIDRQRETAAQNPPVNVIDFRVWATAEQLQALRTFLFANGIRYGRVPAGEISG